MKDVSIQEMILDYDAGGKTTWTDICTKAAAGLSAPVQPGPRPKCPKCGGKVELRHNKAGVWLQCLPGGCEKTWQIANAKELAQFFAPAQAPPPHSCITISAARLRDLVELLEQSPDCAECTDLPCLICIDCEKTTCEEHEIPATPSVDMEQVDEKRLAEITVEFVQKWRHENLGCPAHKGNGENSLICKEWTDKDVTDFLLEQIESLRRRVPQPVTPEPSKRLTKKQGRAARRREKRAVLAAMPYRDASEWAEGMVTVKELVIGPIRSNEWQVVFCGYEFPANKDKAMVDRHADDLRRALRRKLRYYGAQEKRALCAVFGQRQKEGREILRPESLATTQGTPEGAKVISATRIVKQEDIGKGGTKKLLDQPDF